MPRIVGHASRRPAAGSIGGADARLLPALEERLALAYIAASINAGTGLPDGHDDPQNADLATWDSRIRAIETKLRSKA